MLTASSVVARPIRILQNSSTGNRVSWATIKDANTGKVLHVGTPAYIRRIARARYNRVVTFSA